MRLHVSVSAGLLFACNPEPAGDSATDSVSSASTEASLGASSTGAPAPTSEATTGASASTGEPAPPDDGLGEYGPCPQGDECQRCVQSAEWSICGPVCPEYGPGWAAGRCPESAVLPSTLCPYDHDQHIGDVCLIRCGDETPCPDPGMLCVPCPEPFVAACAAFADWPNGGPDMCVWPKL